MKLSVKICLLIGIVLPIAAVYFYIYEASSMGGLQVINYPLRPFALPLLVAGFLFLFFGIVLHRFSSETK